ncbi:MAG: DUF1385 domain-containing protein [Firmicutes bacterium]|nr:DUF1385 domain-containing protein [Bacillota bacterium]
MYGGVSGSQGILVYNTKLKGENAVLGYYEGNQIRLLEGRRDELQQTKDEMEKPFKTDDRYVMKSMAALFVIDFVSIIGAFVWGGFRMGLAVTVFAAGAYMPILIVNFARHQNYISKDLREQFRMNHGCEHATISMMTRSDGEDISMEQLKSSSIYDSECGTAYSGYGITISLVLSILILLGGSLGLLKSLGILLLTLVMLLLNVFNPYNPYLLLQRPVVTKPDERTYALGFAICERIREMERR